jgi:microcystin-dependent protein
MDISDIVVEVRDSALNRVGQILPNYLVGLEAVLRHNKVGGWKIDLPATHPMVESLRQPGSGIIVTTSQGVLISGPTTKSTLVQDSSDPEGYWEIEGVDDSVVLLERLAYPDPTTNDVTTQASAYDVRTGVAETIVKAYVNANIGPGAVVEREISTLTIGTDLARGDTVTGSARFDTLESLCSSLLKTSNLGFNVLQAGNGLVFDVYQPVDRAAEIRMDVFNARLEKSEYSYTRPGATRVIVAGQGTGVDRTFVERSSTESVAAETTWSRRIEVFKDQRNTNDTAELQQAGDEILVEQGSTVEGVSVSPSDDQTMRYGVDWNLGDTVTVVAGSVEVSRVVTEVAIVVTDSGVKVGATVGNSDAASSKDTVSVLASNQSNQEERISNLERNDTAAATPGGGGADFTSVLKHEVKLAESIAKGQAVYVSGANGTNILVSKASNATEATSSKTMGLLETGGATNAFVNVVTEGLLAGLDTSAAANGDPVWLGTGGNLIYGLASKPVAPAHLVFIGVVTRSNNSNGEIFVRPQNGFEFQELHNVLITDAQDNEALYYDSATGLWKNGYRSDTPTGAIIATAAATAPSGWLICDGTAVSRTTYANLFGVIGTTYGAGNGTTTFNLPNLKGRVPVGRDAAQTEFDLLAETGGAKTHTHTPGTFAAAIGAIAGSTLRIGYQPGGVVAGGPTTATYGIQGASQQNNQGFNHYTPVHGVTSDGSSLQPYLVVNYVIKHTSAYAPTDTELASRVGTLEAIAPAGTHEIIPSSVSVGTGTATVDATGFVTFTSVDYVQLNDVFTTNYRNYVMVFERTAGSAATDSMIVQLVSGTTPATAALYDNNRIFAVATGATGTSQVLASTAFQTSVTVSSTAGYQFATVEFAGPKLVRPTGAKWTVGNWVTAVGLAIHQGIGYHRNNTSYEGIRLISATGGATTSTGTVKVYGYN